MKEFLEAASKDEALKNELKALSDSKTFDADVVKAGVIELAAKHGFTLTQDDFKCEEMTELTEDEMKVVAGRRKVCTCFKGGTGKTPVLSCSYTYDGIGWGWGFVIVHLIPGRVLLRSH